MNEVFSFIWVVLNGDSRKKAMSESICGCDRIMKSCNGNCLIRERRKTKMAAALNLLDSKDIGILNSIGEIKRICLLSVCVSACIPMHT